MDRSTLNIESYSAAIERVGYHISSQRGVLWLSGEDAVDFINRQSTNNLKTLQRENSMLTILTTPAARIMDLLQVFFGDMATMGWPGQFNLDFMCFLVLSALWLSWRHHFSPIGILLGVVGFFGGALFLSAYLFIESVRAKGDFKALLPNRVRVNG